MTGEDGKRPASAKAQIKLRVPEWLRVELEKAAKAHGYSLNREIMRRLEISVAKPRDE